MLSAMTTGKTERLCYDVRGRLHASESAHDVKSILQISSSPGLVLNSLAAALFLQIREYTSRVQQQPHVRGDAGDIVAKSAVRHPAPCSGTMMVITCACASVPGSVVPYSDTPDANGL